ncbi:ABC transporter substrate-binding protein [Marivita sp. S0852]|uniref:ABC transporter substrate-binding protein n=1 Tax=Marivita sp. S0852 TaxID=3373893 RepID=UPI0039821951
MTHHPNRRDILALSGAIGLSSLWPGTLGATTLDHLALFGPPAGPSITLAHAAATNRFAAISDQVSFTVWRSPDQLRAGLTSGEIQLSVVPVQAAANLYNRGFPIRLANIMTDGLLYVMSDDPNIRAIPDLAGRHVAVPFRGDTPELIFAGMLAHHGVSPDTDLKLTYAGTPIEAMQMLLAGRVDAALTAEPSTTMGMIRAEQDGRSFYRSIDIQAAWGQMTGGAGVLPQAGLAVTSGFLDAHGSALPDILNVLESATIEVLEHPEDAAGHAAGPLKMPVALLAASVPHCNLVARSGDQARADIERMLSAISGEEYQKIGGALPGDDFYL